MLVPALVLAAAMDRPSLVLVTLDTLRADRLRCYGYQAIETPATDGLAREGVLLEDATVQAPQTRPSHASLLTGRLPYEHGIRDNNSPPLEPRVPTLASILKAQGYRTAAFVGSSVLAPPSGLDRGFDVYDGPSARAGRAGLDARPERPGAEVVDAALAWLRKPSQAPFFAWLHLFDPHAPYLPPPPYDRRYAARPYDGEVAYADAQLGRVLQFLDQKGLRPNTLVVVTAVVREALLASLLRLRRAGRTVALVSLDAAFEGRPGGLTTFHVPPPAAFVRPGSGPGPDRAPTRWMRRPPDRARWVQP